jgi:hypothetical protein
MKELLTEVDKDQGIPKDRELSEALRNNNATPLEIVEAHTTDLRERQYNASIASGSTPEEAAIESGWNPKA